MLGVYSACKGLVCSLVASAASRPAGFAEVELKLLEAALDTLFLFMTFPFLISIMEFNSEHTLDTTDVIFLPDCFQELFIDLPFFEALLAAALETGLPLSLRAKAVKVLSRLPAVRRTISHDAAESDRFLTFCMRATVRIVGGHFGDLSEACLDEVIDMIERTNRIYSVEDLCKHLDVAQPFIRAVLQVVRGIFSKRYTIGSQRAERANEILLHFLTYSVKRNDREIGQAIADMVAFYVDSFFGQAPASVLLDEEVLANSDLREIKGDIAASYKLFEESYHYLEDVKLLIHTKMADAFFNTHRSLVQSPDFGLNHEKQQTFLATMVNFIYTCVCSFLSFINVNARDDFGFSSLVLQNFGANSNRETDAQKEGEILGRIFGIVQEFEKLFEEEQLELMIDVAETDPELDLHALQDRAAVPHRAGLHVHPLEHHPVRAGPHRARPRSAGLLEPADRRAHKDPDRLPAED